MSIDVLIKSSQLAATLSAHIDALSTDPGARAAALRRESARLQASCQALPTCAELREVYSGAAFQLRTRARLIYPAPQTCTSTT